ncbi:MAG: 23S rRNA (adenine(2503)-C(2))-methyltransferase RlmN [Bacteroidales bacterium]|nr:23S rRNA (adenine(2503)-C(2))-methyltransferase RlmN [Bacteroidales bacterium]
MKLSRDIKSLSLEELEQFLENNGEKKFRAKQIFNWLWKNNVSSFETMNNIPLPTRNLLEKTFTFYPVKINTQQTSEDGTIKLAFSLADGNFAEGVLIPSEDRTTACISSQVGCNLGCKFCATARLGFTRNLTAGEIVDQVIEINKLSLQNYQRPLSNIVFMGMGEPLLNYAHVLFAIKCITAEYGLGMSPRRITVSTAGVAKMIKKLADDEVKFNLAISLHSANEEKRDDFMPINKGINLSELSEAIVYFWKKTNTRVTLEYLLLKDYNDSIKAAQELALFCKAFPCKINVIEFNPVEGLEFERSTNERTQKFVEILESKNMIVNIRRSRGKDIDAACGQLANKIAKNT